MTANTPNFLTSLTKHPVLSVSVAAVAALSLAGCSAGGDSGASPAGSTAAASAPASDASASGGTQPASSNSAESESSNDGAKVGKIDVKSSGVEAPQKAIDAALQEYAGATATEVDVDNKTNTIKVSVLDGNEVRELRVDENGKVTQDKTEAADKEDKSATNAKVDLKEALTKAIGDHSDWKLDEANIDTDQGKAVWEIEFDDADGHDAGQVYVDIDSGDVRQG